MTSSHGQRDGASDLACEILDGCLRNGSWPQAVLDQLTDLCLSPDPETARSASRVLFTSVVEPLSDSFEPRLADAYVRLFSYVIERAIPGLDAKRLVERFEQVRRTRPAAQAPPAVGNVIVLSRITLGADIAVTSVLLDAAKKRFPGARVWFAGPAKNWELFAADPRLSHLPLRFARGGTLVERLEAWRPLSEAFALPRSVVLDPDSRITQLGLLRVCDEDRYYFFESRSYAPSSASSLSELASRWAAETFGIENARSYVAPQHPGDSADITVSLGVGENTAKRVDEPFEAELVRALAQRCRRMLIDKGAAGEEVARVERAIAASGAPPDRIDTWFGAFAPFAASIARSRLYAGYDSAAQHVAAACGVPLVTAFAGAVSDRFFERWRPSGAGLIEVVRTDASQPSEALRQVLAAVDRLGVL